VDTNLLLPSHQTAYISAIYQFLYDEPFRVRQGLCWTDMNQNDNHSITFTVGPPIPNFISFVDYPCGRTDRQDLNICVPFTLFMQRTQ